MLLNLVTELWDLFEIIHPQNNVKGADHCSALIKWLPDIGEVYVSHNSWSSYSMMLRVLKKYTLNYQESQAKSISFSSYPGLIFSLDDFYITSQNLVRFVLV